MDGLLFQVSSRRKRPSHMLKRGTIGLKPGVSDSIARSHPRVTRQMSHGIFVVVFMLGKSSGNSNNYVNLVNGHVAYDRSDMESHTSNLSGTSSQSRPLSTSLPKFGGLTSYSFHLVSFFIFLFFSLFHCPFKVSREALYRSQEGYKTNCRVPSLPRHEATKLTVSFRRS